ncbi:hypothetical protein [Bartonella taylorii]|uniref:hypothetical protein n=1 Tax=Bartonella taylorii TaxID=33046 RepID=UPI001ABA0E09|nr:hypothetical protein [Bartonella taylorii]
MLGTQVVITILVNSIFAIFASLKASITANFGALHAFTVTAKGLYTAVALLKIDHGHRIATQY